MVQFVQYARRRHGNPCSPRTAAVLLVAALLLVPAASAFAQSDGFKSVSQDGYSLQWRVNGDNAEFIVEAPTDGWVGIGFDASRMMADANIIMGYVDGGEQTLTDQFGTGPTAHRADTDLGGSNDIIEGEVTQSAGSTTLRFTIPLDSGDQYDTVLREGRTHSVLLANGPSGSDDTSTYHGGNRTVFEIEL
jgi:hypothetical protein